MIKSLLLDDEAIGEAVVFKVTVLQSTIEYERTNLEQQNDFQTAVLTKLAEKKPFSPRHNTSLNEGFLEFAAKDNEADFYYIREVAFRWEFVSPQSGSIESMNLKRVDSSYRVRIRLMFEPSKVTATFFGGMDTLVFRARFIVCAVIKDFVQNFVEKDVTFSSKQMQMILEKFGKHVALINIDPRDNERFSKIVERREIGKPEMTTVVLYDISNFRMSGIQIVNSPEVSRLIREENIHLTEISGGLFLDLGFV
jgi:hypothetical protein